MSTLSIPSNAVAIIVNSGGEEKAILCTVKPSKANIMVNVPSLTVYEVNPKDGLPKPGTNTPHLHGCVRSTEGASGDLLGCPVVAFVVPKTSKQQELPATAETIPAPAESPAPKGKGK